MLGLSKLVKSLQVTVTTYMIGRQLRERRTRRTIGNDIGEIYTVADIIDKLNIVLVYLGVVLEYVASHTFAAL